MKKANVNASLSGYESPSMRAASLLPNGILCLSEVYGFTEDVAINKDADYWFQGTEDMSDGVSDWF